MGKKSTGKVPVVANLQYATEGGYREKLAKAAQTGECPMCSKGFQNDPKYKILAEYNGWYVRQRTREYPSPDRGGQYPKEYFLIVRRIHDDELEPADWAAVGFLVDWLIKTHCLKGGGVCMRFGDERGGRTIFHPHFHVVEPNLEGFVDGKPRAVPWDFPVG